MFRRLPDASAKPVTIEFEGRPIEAREGDTVAAAVLAAAPGHTRTMPGTGSPRLPYCLMGVCFECLMEIDGVANRQSCLVPVRDGMKVRRQMGARAAGE
jgi:predicted molibdopterin-dependent oxidoreductase YjgC